MNIFTPAAETTVAYIGLALIAAWVITDLIRRVHQWSCAEVERHVSAALDDEAADAEWSDILRAIDTTPAVMNRRYMEHQANMDRGVA